MRSGYKRVVYRSIDSLGMCSHIPSTSEWVEMVLGSDQLALEQLFIYAHQHVAEAAYTAFELPMETFMLAMILEMHKEVIRLRKELGNITK
jgi:hypothetical protein